MSGQVASPIVPALIQDLLDDVQQLLSHLQRLPETRLPRFFDQAAQNPAPPNAPRPPATNLAYFLDRIGTLAAKPPATASDTTEPRGAPPEPDAGSKLNDYAFLICARDFLSAVTAPATVESIRVTRAYREARVRPRGAVTEPTGPNAMPVRYGRMLSQRIRFYFRMSLFFIAVSVWSSFMTFSGHVLIRENDTLQAARRELAGRMTLAETDERRRLIEAYEQVGASPLSTAPLYCNLRLPPKPDSRVAALGGAAPAIPVSEGEFLLPRQAQLCGEQTVLNKREFELKTMHWGWFKTSLPLRILVSAPDQVRRGLETLVCFVRTAIAKRDPPQPIGSPKPAACPEPDPMPEFTSLELTTHRFGMEQMVSGLIGAILPVTYAVLGALAALFRRISLRAEREWLDPSDYGSMRTSMILGVLTGTVIGLFGDVLNPSGAVPLGSTALALLAGFASDRVFTMLDQLAMRVFGPSRTDVPAIPAK